MIKTGVYMALMAGLLAPPAMADELPPQLSAPGQEEAGADQAGESPSGDAPSDSSVQESTKRVYRTVGEDGSVMFTDQGDDSLEEVQIRKPNTVDISVPRIAPPPSEEKTEPGKKLDDGLVNYKVRITQPESEQTYHNPSESLAVGFKVSPTLRQSHKAQVVFDGQVLDGLEIPQPPRGEHTVVVRVVDASGAELAVSEPVTFYVQRVSRRLPSGGAKAN